MREIDIIRLMEQLEISAVQYESWLASYDPVPVPVPFSDITTDLQLGLNNPSMDHLINSSV